MRDVSLDTTRSTTSQKRPFAAPQTIRTRTSAMSACLALVFGLIAIPSVHAETKIDPTQLLGAIDNAPANLSGLVKSADGKPIEGALVTIYSAGVRVGTSPFCPTCYADCGKRVATAADGTFTIEKLDPSLVFRVLVIAKGFEPKFVNKVDPAKAKQLDLSMKARPDTPDDRARVVGGQVFSPNNTPLAGALIEPFGCKSGERRWWGSMPGVDPLAVTDDNGNFEIVAAEPVEALDLEVSARGMAKKKFALVPSGKNENRLTLSAGATVRGCLFKDGKPLRGVSIGLVQADRGSEDFIGATQIGTDSDGQFLFTNVPADREYFVYGIMNSLKKHGAVAARSVKVSGDDTTSEAGDLAVTPAFRIKGRIALSDGKPLPPHTRVLLSRDQAWDSQTVQADTNGNFEALGIPPEIISITASIPNYHTSEKNKSLERLNGTSIEGLVSADIDGLTILLEPGKHQWHDWSKSPAEWRAVVRTLDALKVNPPAGVTADLKPLAQFDPNIIEAPPTSPRKVLPKIDIPAPEPSLPTADADLPQRSITGRVIDQNGKPAADAEVWFPVRWVAAANILTAHAKCAPNGTFNLKFPAEWISDDVTKTHTTIWAYADGHSIGIGNAYKQMRDAKHNEPCEISLDPPASTEFTILLPDGRPAIGVTVQPQHFRGSQGYEYVPNAILAKTSAVTDSKGHVALPVYPLGQLLNLNVSHGERGKQQFELLRLPGGSSPELKLRPTGRIEGRVLADQPELFRDMVVEIETQGDRTGEPTSAGQALITIDKDGRFTIPDIAEGMVELSVVSDNRLPVRARLPERSLEVVAGKTTRIEIPLEMTVNVHGIIRIKGSNQPVSGATIYVNYGVGRQGENVKSDEAGKFSTRVLSGKVGMQVIHIPYDQASQLSDSRSARYSVPDDAVDFELPPIELTKTQTLSGRLLDNAGKPVPKRRISGINGNHRYGFGESDNNGDFKLTGVPEGITLEKFEIWSENSTGRPSESIIDSTDPLVVRLK